MDPMTILAATMIGNCIGNMAALAYTGTSVPKTGWVESEDERTERIKKANDARFAAAVKKRKQKENS